MVVIDFSLSEIFDGISDVGIIYESKDIVVRDASLLFGGEVLVKIGEKIALDGEIRGCEGYACGRYRIDTRSMIDEIGVEARALDLLGREVFGQLKEDSGNHLHMSQFVCSQMIHIIEAKKDTLRGCPFHVQL